MEEYTISVQELKKKDFLYRSGFHINNIVPLIIDMEKLLKYNKWRRDMMEQHEKDMQLIALLSGELGEEHTFTECSTEEVEHFCNEKNSERMIFHLYEVEFFKEGKVRTAKANFCEYCNHVFIYKS